MQLKPDIILCEKLNCKHCCSSAGRNLSSIIGAQRAFLSWFISEKCWFFMRKSLQRGSLSFLQQTQGLCFPAAHRLKRHEFSDGLLLASHSVISTGKQYFITLITTLRPCFNMITQTWGVPDFAALKQLVMDNCSRFTRWVHSNNCWLVYAASVWIQVKLKS